MTYNYIEHICKYKDNEIMEMVKNKLLVTGIVKRLDKNDNLNVELDNGYKGLINADNAITDSFSFQERKRRLITLVGLPVRGYVVDYKSDSFIINRKKYIEEVKQDILLNVKVEDKVVGYVRSIQPAAVFLDIGGDVVGRLQRKNIKYKLPTDFIKVGNLLKATVANFDKTNFKIEFKLDDIKDPWEVYGKHIKSNEYFYGKVLNHYDNLQFIQLYPGIDAVLSIYDKCFLEYGRYVRVRVKSNDYLNKRIKVELSGL